MLPLLLDNALISIIDMFSAYKQIGSSENISSMKAGVHLPDELSWDKTRRLAEQAWTPMHMYMEILCCRP